MTLEEFFKKHYRAMCNYCERHNFRLEDVEEQVSDVIYKRYDQYVKLTDGDEIKIRNMMNRRVMLNIRTILRLYRNKASEYLEDVTQVSLDDPMEILSVKQRLPEIPDILIDYQQSSNWGNAHTHNEVKRFSRAKCKFMKELTT